MDDFKIKIAQDVLKDHNVLVIKKMTQDLVSGFSWKPDFEGMLVIERNGVIETVAISIEELESIGAQYDEYLKEIVKRAYIEIENIKYIQNNEEGVSAFADVVASAIFCEGIIVGKEKMKQSWLNYESIKRRIKEKMNKNELNQKIYMDLLKEEGCTWGIKKEILEKLIK